MTKDEATTSPKDAALKLALDLAIMHHSDDGYAELRSKVRQLAKEALAQDEQSSSQEPMTWNPIKTAPKDASMILVCLPRQMNIVVRAWYNRIHGFWQTDYEGEGGITRPTYFHEGDLWHPIPPIYTTPPKRPWGKPWVSLTDDEASWCQAPSTIQTWKRIEAKLKEKNT